MADLILCTNPQPRGAIMHWMLEELGEPFEHCVVDYRPARSSDSHLAIDPLGKVPALVHRKADGDRVVTEAAAICADLADAFPARGLAPAPTDRAARYRWLFFAAGPSEQSITNRFFGLVPTDERLKVRPACRRVHPEAG